MEAVRYSPAMIFCMNMNVHLKQFGHDRQKLAASPGAGDHADLLLSISLTYFAYK